MESDDSSFTIEERHLIKKIHLIEKSANFENWNIRL